MTTQYAALHHNALLFTPDVGNLSSSSLNIYSFRFCLTVITGETDGYTDRV